MRGLLVTATDTGVGKTVVSASLLAAMRRAGERVVAHKPVVTGLGEPPEGDWPADHELLGAAAGMPAEEVTPLRYRPAVSPHLAARLAGEQVSGEQLLAAARAACHDRAGSDGVSVVEGVGGLLVPLTDEYTVRDLAAALGLALVIAARPGLGTINHTLLTLQAARQAGLEVRAVVLTPWPEQPSAMEESNRATIARLGGVEVATLTRLPAPTLDDLAEAGESLPWRSWLQRAAPG